MEIFKSEFITVAPITISLLSLIIILKVYIADFWITMPRIRSKSTSTSHKHNTTIFTLNGGSTFLQKAPSYQIAGCITQKISYEFSLL
jgi:uncharacterized protein YpmS